MRVICALLTLLSAADPQPNTLTPEEAAAGWELLFDGTETRGLRFRGHVSTEDGCLVVGGGVGSRIGLQDPVPDHFEWRLEYRVLGGDSAVSIVERSGIITAGLGAQALPQWTDDPTAWHELTLRGTYDPQTGLRTLHRTVRLSGREESQSLGMFHDDLSTTLWLQVLAGDQLLVRNIKWKAERVNVRGRLWLYGVIAAIVLLPLAGFALWRRRKPRPAA